MGIKSENKQEKKVRFSTVVCQIHLVTSCAVKETGFYALSSGVTPLLFVLTV